MIKFYSGVYNSLTLCIYDLITNELLGEYSFPSSPQIVCVDKDFYVDYSPSVKDVVFEITTVDGKERLLRSFPVKDPSSASSVGRLYVDWSSFVAYDYYNSNRHKGTYKVSYKKKDSSIYYTNYILRSDTESVVDFSSYVNVSGQSHTQEFFDQNSALFFRAYSGALAAVSNDYESFTNQSCVRLGLGYLESINLLLSTEHGLSFGCVYDSILTLDAGSLSVVITETGAVTFSVNLSPSLTISRTLPDVVLGGIHSVVVTMDLNYARLYIDGQIVFSLDLLFLGSLPATPVIVNLFTLSQAYTVKDFFYETGVKSGVEIHGEFIRNVPVEVLTTSFTEALLSFSDLPSDLENYYIVVEGFTVNGALCFSKLFNYRDLRVLRGSWCFVWGVLNLSYSGRQGVYFEVMSTDKVGAFSYPSRQVLVAHSGLFGLYLPCDAIYTMRLIDDNRTFRFVVPRDSSACLTNLVSFDRPYLKGHWR